MVDQHRADAGKAGSPQQRPRVLIFVVAYEAETTIRSVLARIPRSLGDDYYIEVLVIDDASTDRTFDYSREVALANALPFPLKVLFNPVNQGYGGNQKIGYRYAVTQGFDFVVLLHGDGQYAPETLPDLLAPLRNGAADACFGSRMIERGRARAGHMPLYKFIGNKLLTRFQNRVLGTKFSEFHSGLRVYSVQALRKVPYELNTNNFHFDTEIIIQFLIAGLSIVERPIPTFYGREISRVDGFYYAWKVMRAVIKARVQALGLFYDRRFDCAPAGGNAHYQLKLGFPSPHTLALDMVPERARVLDLGCAGGYFGEALKARKGCRVVGVDVYELPQGVALDGFYRHDLNRGLPALDVSTFDVVLLLDVVEHLSYPEAFVERLRQVFRYKPDTTILVSTGNIGFFVMRLMLLLGQFNYGKRGILDLTHTRLFTFSSLKRLFEQNGFQVIASRGVPAPFPLASGRYGRLLLRLNDVLIRVSERLFAYQIFMTVRPYPGVEYLLQQAEEHSERRAAASG